MVPLGFSGCAKPSLATEASETESTGAKPSTTAEDPAGSTMNSSSETGGESSTGGFDGSTGGFGGSTGSTGDSSSSGEPGGELPEFPLPRDASQVALVEQQARTIAGVDVEIAFYRNEAYGCGLTGAYTFVIISPLDHTSERPLWVFLRSGGGGYFDYEGNYHHGGAARVPVGNDEFPATSLLEPFLRSAEVEGQLRDTLLGRRLGEGYRFLLPAPCDHDVFSGIGQPYPRAPNGGTVDGLLATMAAVDYTRANFDTGSVTAHGTSAGSFGAYGLAYAYAREGTLLRAAIMDSGLATPRNRETFGLGCTLAQQFDPDIRFDLLEEKLGPFFSHPRLIPEGAIADGFDDVPLYVLAGGDDPRCCDPSTSVSDRFDDNCSFVHAGVTEAVAASQPNLHRSVVVAGEGHVLTDAEGPWVEEIDDWLASVDLR